MWQRSNKNLKAGGFQVLGVSSHTGEAADQERQQHASQSRTGNGQASESNQEQLASTANSLRLNVPRTLRDDLLLKQCNEIKERYMATFNAKLASMRADFRSASKQVLSDLHTLLLWQQFS